MLAQSTSAARLHIVAPPVAPPSLRRLLLPREHGSWGMWLLPLLAGAVVGAPLSKGGAVIPVLWLLIAVTAGFLAYQPVEVLLSMSPLRARSSKERNAVRSWIFGCIAIGIVSLIQLLQLRRTGVVWFALVGVLCFDVRWVLGQTRSFRVAKQLIGALALSSTAAAAYYVAAGSITRTGFLLWLLFWIFSVVQIEFVQLCIRTANATARAQKLVAGAKILGLHAALFFVSLAASIGGLAPVLFGFCFLPSLIRFGLWLYRPPQKINFKALGFSELFQSVLFTTLLTVAFL